MAFPEKQFSVALLITWRKGAWVRGAAVRGRTLRIFSFQRQLFPVSHSQSQFNKWQQSHAQEELQKFNNFVTKCRGNAQHRQFDSHNFDICTPLSPPENTQ